MESGISSHLKQKSFFFLFVTRLNKDEELVAFDPFKIKNHDFFLKDIR